MNYKPMLASPLAKSNIQNWNEWAIEEKYDGHRLIVHVTAGGVHAFTRPRKHAGAEGKTMATQELPEHLTRDLRRLPDGVYDGELIAGRTSTDVRRTDLRDQLQFVVFDVLEFAGASVCSSSYDARRDLLKRMVFEGAIMLAESRNLARQTDVTRFVEQVWKRGGEGAILKRRAAMYQCNKRSPDCVKVKKLKTAVLTLVGFEPSRGKVFDRGVYATLVLERDGARTSVKTPDDDTLRDLERAAKDAGTFGRADLHPWVVRRRQVRIEFQDETPDGGFRHPRFDRWEDE